MCGAIHFNFSTAHMEMEESQHPKKISQAPSNLFARWFAPKHRDFAPTRIQSIKHIPLPQRLQKHSKNPPNLESLRSHPPSNPLSAPMLPTILYIFTRQALGLQQQLLFKEHSQVLSELVTENNYNFRACLGCYFCIYLHN